MDATTLRLPEISDRHARGLRRDLFRKLAEHRERHRKTLDARLAMVAMPLRGMRERKGSYLRAADALARSCFGFASADGAITGTLIEPQELAHASGSEPVLAMTTVLITLGEKFWRLTVLDAGRVSHHVVERMFQRLVTTDTREVCEELGHGFVWSRLLQIELGIAADRARIVEIPIPTPRGALLARWDGAIRSFNARTWLRRGMNARVDASVALLERWRTEPRHGRPLGAGFRALLEAPENAWWRQALDDEPAFPSLIEAAEFPFPSLGC
jgi:hypothetical protein